MLLTEDLQGQSVGDSAPKHAFLDLSGAHRRIVGANQSYLVHVGVQEAREQLRSELKDSKTQFCAGLPCRAGYNIRALCQDSRILVGV